ncbi:hypothetical protein [Opitutus sp. GAS368]|uniref:hypothetical protein n=1 Tax=Opitutus sp. GAS368 TaxID=1882749 RepID=UPI00087B473A|nr:hypothetical protein [Opitutus sp. GAS368]SDS06001.1 hypothetical protein SAMN05444173_1766 [Opitutus sp. GAS368]
MALASPTYSVTLHHLAPGAVAAGLAYPDEQLSAVSLPQLREMLYALGEVSSRLTIYEPSTPEIRIKTDREIFVVRTRYRRLCFVGYEAALRGEEHSVAYILTTITGTTEVAKAPEPRVERPSAASIAASAAPEDTGRIPRWLKIAVMAAIIVGCNGTAAWLLLRPPRSPAPAYTLMVPDESAALLGKVAGEYRTGSQEGDRRLIIDPDGTLRLARFGQNQAVTQPTTKTARGALVDNRPALITSDPAAITLKDADTLVFFGVTYKRHNP